jgi:hypothetical protein
LEQLLSTANALRQDGFLLTTPRTFGCARSIGLKPTKRWFIASANKGRIAQMFLESKQRGLFISMSEGKGAPVLP